MSEIKRLVDQLQRAHNGAAWSGPSLCALLVDVSAAKAAARPAIGTHSIWTLVGHIIAWERVVTRRLAGEQIADLPEAENFPVPSDNSEAAWGQMKHQLELAHQQVCAASARLTEADLDAAVSGQNYSVYVMLHGLVQHKLYHAGQIALLRKA